MKVKDLIEKLRNFNQDSNIVIYMTDHLDEPVIIDSFEMSEPDALNNKSQVCINCGNQNHSFAAGHYLYDKDPLFIDKTKQLLNDFNRIYLNTGGSNRYILTFRDLEEDLTEVQNIVKSIIDGWKTNYTNPNKL